VISSFLNKPYPYIESPTIRLALSFVIGLVVFLLLNTYRPFGIEQIPLNETAFVAGFGLIAMLSLMVSLFTFPFFIKIEDWNIRSEVQLHVFNWALTSIWAYAYNSTIGADISPQHGLPYFFLIVAAIYLVPLQVMIFITEKYLQQRNKEEAKSITHQMDRKGEISNNHEQLIIQPDTTSSPSIVLETAQFIYAASDNNYVMLHFINDKKTPNHQLVRLSLKRLEAQLKAQSAIIRCHKSYLVNRNHIQEVSGNARSLYLKVNHFDFQIPVSRSFDRSQLS